MSQENVEVIRAVNEAWNAGDMDAFREQLDPDVVMYHVKGWPEPGPTVGRGACMRFIEQLRDDGATGRIVRGDDETPDHRRGGRDGPRGGDGLRRRDPDPTGSIPARVPPERLGPPRRRAVRSRSIASARPCESWLGRCAPGTTHH